MDEEHKDLSFLLPFVRGSHWTESMTGKDSGKGGMPSTNFCDIGEEESSKGGDLSWVSSKREG